MTSVFTPKSDLRFELTTLAGDDRPVYLTGNFCDWYPDIEAYRMTQVSPGQFVFRFPDHQTLPSVLEYKYTRGSWQEAELDSMGQAPANRHVKPTKKRIVRDSVPFWKKRNQPSLDAYQPIVEILPEGLRIGSLKRSRKIHVLLPASYATQPTRRYPVLYLTDAQNLYGQGSAYGNWHIDKRLAVLAAQEGVEVIVVAIEHGDKHRIQEFSPYQNPKLGKGKGRVFVQAVVSQLKPFIDSHYRTLPDRTYTGIGGSSLGGLLASFAGLTFPEVFGRLMVFSPSLWVSNRIFFDVIHFFEPYDTRLYLYGGGKEGASMVQNLKALYETIDRQGFATDKLSVKLQIDPEGEHKEARWGEEFPGALRWLFAEGSA